MKKKIPQCETVAQVVNRNHGEIYPRENTRWEEEEKCCVFKFSRPVKENSGGVLTVKLDYVLKGALVDIIPVLIM
jgi:hypothetical protein